MANISKSGISLLIALGKIGDASLPAARILLEAISRHEAINSEHHATWYAACESLPLVEHEELVMGLVIAEEHHGWIGGSVAAAIWAFRSFADKHPDHSDALASWCLSRTSNCYVPFGTNNHGAKTIEEYRASEKRRNGRQAEIAELEKVSRQMRQLRREQVLRATADRHGHVRESFLDALCERSLEEQIALAAYDSEYPINWYPTSIAGACRGDVLATMDPGIKAALVLRLKGKQHGPWLALKKRIRSEI